MERHFQGLHVNGGISGLNNFCQNFQIKKQFQ